MNTLVSRIATDLNIGSYRNETNSSYTKRVFYSALGLWCLKIADHSNNDQIGISKNGQTRSLEMVIDEFVKQDNSFSEYFQNKPRELSVSIRTLYERVGYLLTDGNINHLSNLSLAVATGTDKDMFIGFPGECNYEANGLGLYINSTSEHINISEFLVRDALDANSLISVAFDICDFEESDVDRRSLQYFDPMSKEPPYRSWKNYPNTRFTIARKTQSGPYYKVINNSAEKMFVCDFNEPSMGNCLYKDEFRRIYFALRDYYKNTIFAWIESIDNLYAKLIIPAKLPMRENSLIMLSAWPYEKAFNYQCFLIRKQYIPMIKTAFNSIFIKMKEF